METTEATEATGPAPETVIDDSIAELLGRKPEQTTREPETVSTPEAGAPAEQSVLDDDATEPASTTPETAPTIKQLAEQAGIDVKDIKFVIDDNGTPREVGYVDFKKGFIDGESLAAERLAFENASAEQANGNLAARRELEQLAALLPPDQIPPGFAEAKQALDVQNAQYEARMTLQAIPSWKDPATMQADRELMVSYMKPWGYSEAELNNLKDHRDVAFVRYHARMVKRVAELEKLQKSPAAAPRRGAVKGKGGNVSELKRQVASGAITGDAAVNAYLKDIGV